MNNHSIHNQIYQQLGGNKFTAMAGASLFSDGNSLIVKFKGSKICNHLTITYISSSDLYELTFAKFRGLNYLPCKTYSYVYADMLRDIFERETGLATSL